MTFRKHVALPLSIVCAVMVEVGSTLAMTNVRPDAPIGFWVWFLGLCVLAPLFPFWMYRQIRRHSDKR